MVDIALCNVTSGVAQRRVGKSLKWGAQRGIVAQGWYAALAYQCENNGFHVNNSARIMKAQ